MTSTYDPSLTTDKDHVRRLIRDTNVSEFVFFTDEEILSFISEQTTTGSAVRFSAAADALDALRAYIAHKGQGLTEKEVDGLRLRWGDAPSIVTLLDQRIESLRVRAAQLTRPAPHSLKCI